MLVGLYILVKGVDMTDLIEIQGQIEKLQKQANEIKVREFKKTVQEILAKMNAFGISLKDIQNEKAHSTKTKTKTTAKAESVGSKTKQKNVKASTVVPAKYRGPGDETWSGRGLTPRWLAALMTQGRAKEEFAIKS